MDRWQFATLIRSGEKRAALFNPRQDPIVRIPFFFANTANQSFVRSAADIRHSEFRCAASVSSLSPSQSWPGMPFSDFLLPAFTWHGFGRNSCVLDTALLLLSAAPPKEFCSLPSPKVENSFGPPQNAVARSGSRRRLLFAPK